MSWIQALQSIVQPVFQPEEPPALPPPRAESTKPGAKAKSRKKKAPRVTTEAGVRLSSSGKKSATGNVKLESGPSTSSVTVKVDEKGRLSGRFGQGFELKFGDHTVVLGASVDSDGDVKSQVSFKSPLLRGSSKR